MAIGLHNHHQCEFSDQTTHGFKCVGIYAGYCEVGKDCLKECGHSYRAADARKVEEAQMREITGQPRPQKPKRRAVNLTVWLSDYR